jgi:hypothetical protein
MTTQQLLVRLPEDLAWRLKRSVPARSSNACSSKLCQPTTARTIRCTEKHLRLSVTSDPRPK